MEGAMHPWLIFVEGLKNWRVNWRKLAVIYLFVYLPLTLIDLFLVSRSGKLDLAQIANSLLHWILDALVMASLILAVQEQLSSITNKALGTIRGALRHLWRYMLTALVYGVIVLSIIMLAVVIISFVFAAVIQMSTINMAILVAAALALIACVTGVVYCVIRFALAGVVCIIEEAWPLRALKTSRSLIKKHVTPVVGVFCFIFLISGLLFFPGFLINALFASQAGGNTLFLIFYQVVAGAVTVPIWVSVMVVLYKKLKEAVQ